MSPNPGPNDALATVLEQLARTLREQHQDRPAGPAPAPTAVTLPWNALLWRTDLVPDATLLTVEQVAAATGWTKAALYKRTSRWHREHSTCAPLPHLTVAGSLRFRVGELRAWLRTHERTVVARTELVVVTPDRKDGAA